MDRSVKGLQQQQGAALILVLFILALITTAVMSITQRNIVLQRSTQNIQTYGQAYWYALAAEQFAMRVLIQDFDDGDGIIHRDQYWASGNVVYPVDGGYIGGEISDMRSCFNLNALDQSLTVEEEKADPYQRPLSNRQFIAMLEANDIDNYGAELLVDRIKDYIDSDEDLSGYYGAEDADYAARSHPYRVANQMMIHHSELRAILGSNRQIYKVLTEFVCVIPGNSRQLLNVNTLEAEQASVLVGMTEGALSLNDAKSLINSRPSDGWDSSQKFWQEPILSNLDLDSRAKSSLVVTSDYFKFEGGAQVGNATFRLESILKKGGEAGFEVLTRQYGGQL